MGAIASHSTATTGSPWDGAAQEARLRTPLSQDAARGFYAWKEGDGWPTTKSAYRFGHHVVGGDGKPGAANLKACSAGIAVLNGGRGGTTIPASDRKGVYAHLARHLKDAGMNPAPLQGAEADNMEATMYDDGGVPGLLPMGRTAWAISPDGLPVLLEMHRRVDAARVSHAAETIASHTELAAARTAQAPVSKVAVIPLSGVLTPKPSLLTLLFGGSASGLQGFRASFREAMGSSDVEGIVINCDSPGGRVSLIPETAQEVADARGVKPVVAVVNTLCASAAYWVASQADEIVTTPSGEAGSIGVYAMHLDWSAANEKQGVSPTLISAGKYKAEANEEAPLSDEARAAWQEQIDEIYGEFVDSVAAGRGVTAASVKDGYGEGRVLRAHPAIGAGLVDRVGTLNATVVGMLSGSGAAHAAFPVSLTDAEQRAADAERDEVLDADGDAQAAGDADPNADEDGDADGDAGEDGDTEAAGSTRAMTRAEVLLG